MSRRGHDYGTDNELPETRVFDDGKTRPTHPRMCCGKGWQKTGLFWLVFIGVVAFIAFEAALVASRNEMAATTRATISMHDTMMEVKSQSTAWTSDLRSHFPPNQETVTAEQILDSIDKVKKRVERKSVYLPFSRRCTQP